jgi:hypothetical protein
MRSSDAKASPPPAANYKKLGDLIWDAATAAENASRRGAIGGAGPLRHADLRLAKDALLEALVVVRQLLEEDDAAP